MSLVLVNVKRSEGFSFHYSDRYKNNCEIITFFEHYEDKNILENFELAKKVIKGESLINAEFI